MANFVALDVFAGIGVVLLIPKLYSLASFTWLYFLRPSSIKKYIHGAPSYAIVTGATDGIGKSTAAELLRNGFNLIIHGRNAEKLARVRDELATGGRDVRVWLADAGTSRGWDAGELRALTDGLDVTIVALANGGTTINSQPCVPALHIDYC